MLILVNMTVRILAHKPYEEAHFGDRLLELLDFGVSVLALLLKTDLLLLTSGEILDRSCGSLLDLLQRTFSPS